jgi:alpha-D-ribose 1-methylphosphonate 5-triphosphate synthase subunit PhnH
VIRELAYDRVLHSQSHFRSILDAMSRPGKINELAAPSLSPPPGLNTASALVAFALLNGDVCFHLVNMSGVEAEYVAANTDSRVAPLEGAAFVFASGQEPGAILEGTDCGTLMYPDTSATLVIQVDSLSAAPQGGALALTLEGPGINGCASVYVRGLNPDLLLALQARNAEFPLGVDAIVTCDERGAGPPRVMGLPRTSKVTWDAS